LELQSERKVGQRGEESEGEAESELGIRIGAREERERVGTCGAMVGRTLLHGRHAVIASSTWWVWLSQSWRLFLGWLRSELVTP
jgi:hypothetical protein